MQDDDDDDITRGRHRGNRYSREAQDTTPGAVRRRQIKQIIAMITERKGHGATSWEAHRTLGIPYTTCSARFSELKRDGVIIESGSSRLTGQGKNAAVCIIAPRQMTLDLK